MNSHRIGIIALYALSIAVALYAFGTYAFGPGSKVLHPDMHANFVKNHVAISTHIFASVVGLLIGPLQFSASLRARWPILHRWAGRIYLSIAVLLGGISGLYMSYFAFGGVVAKLGFAGLALAWLYTGARGYLAARSRDFIAHRRWMVRNFSLTFAAVTLRIYLPPVFVFQLNFPQAYAMIAWLCWVPNLLVAEWLLRRDRIGAST